MRTAVLVLAILGDVFGGIGALLALAFGASLVGLSGGVAGQGAAGGAMLALLALVIGIVGTALASRRPRVAGTLLVIAAILGLVGTFSFALGSLLYVIGGVMAFFVRPVSAVPAGQTAPSPEVGVNSQPRRPRLLPRITRRTGAVAAVLVVVIAILGSLAAAQNAEQKPVKALIAAIVRGDDVALAALLDPALRSGNAGQDAERVLTLALGRSELSYINSAWLRRMGPVTGTTMAFENVSYATANPGGSSAAVHLRGLFSPSNENPIVNLLLQAFRGSFDADVAVANVSGGWYVTGPGVVPPPSRSPGVVVDSRPATAPPTLPPSPTPPPATPKPTVTLVPPVLFAADFSAPSGLPSQGRSYSLNYQGGHALLNQCPGGLDRCVWGVNSTGLVTIAATGESRTGASCPACGDWGLVFRAGPTNWMERGLADNATLAMISPTTGEYQLIVVTNLNETVLAKAACTCVNRVGANTVEVGLSGTQLYLAINGVEVTRVPDTQGTRGAGYGVFIRQNINDTTSLDLSYFAGK